MPIYEYYCGQCNTLYKFLSKKIDTGTVPNCPTCKTVALERKMSLFAAVSGGREDNDGMPPLDEAKMEKTMAMLTKEASAMKEDDPRQAAQLMRKLTEATGLKMGGGMEEALRRMEKGEDPEKIEREMGDLFDSEEPFTFENRGKRDSSRQKPRVDETLYDL